MRSAEPLYAPRAGSAEVAYVDAAVKVAVAVDIASVAVGVANVSLEELRAFIISTGATVEGTAISIRRATRIITRYFFRFVRLPLRPRLRSIGFLVPER